MVAASGFAVSVLFSLQMSSFAACEIGPDLEIFEKFQVGFDPVTPI